MKRDITQSLESNMLHAFGLMDRFVEVCPDDVWVENFGGWPVWQQVYHAFAAMGFFLRAADAPEETPPFGAVESSLRVVASGVAGKAELKEYIARAKEAAGAYASALDDAALDRPNEGFSARMNRTTTHAGVLSLIAAHTMYHLGACDAALRQRGLAGVF